MRAFNFTWVVTLLCLPLCALAESSGVQLDSAAAPSMEEVVVTGEWAGPRLWKVSNGAHVLWILGTLQPLPKRMTWQSKEVESVLQESQQLLGNTAIRAKLNIFNALPLYLQVRKVAKLPDKQTLQAVLPAELYQRYAKLKARYAARDDELDKLRPLAAAGRLYQHALDAVDLTARPDVQQAVTKLAKKYDVNVRDMTLKVDDPRGALKELDHISQQAELACFSSVLTSLETEVDAMKARAAAWAKGDVNGLRQLPYPDERSSCWGALLSVPRVKAVNDQAQANWMMAAEDALRSNPSTLAMSPIYDLLGDKGALARLRAAGYQVEGP